VLKRRWLIPIAIGSIVVLGASTCEEDKQKGKSSEKSQLITEQYQTQMETAVPYPLDAMRDSIERRNLKERLLRFNKPDKIGYVYLLSDVGSVVAFYTIKGKISSTQSQLTSSEILRDGCGRDKYCGVAVEAPGDDGSYGPNEDGIFFFTTEGVLVQWSGRFLYADAPLKVTSAPILVADQNAKPTG